MEDNFKQKVFKIQCTKPGHQNNFLHSCCVDRKCQKEQHFEAHCLICQQENQMIHNQLMHTQMSTGQLLINLQAKVDKLPDDYQQLQIKNDDQLTLDLQKLINKFQLLINNLTTQMNKYQNDLQILEQMQHQSFKQILLNLLNDIVDNKKEFVCLNQYFNIEDNDIKIIKIDQQNNIIQEQNLKNKVQACNTILDLISQTYVSNLYNFEKLQLMNKANINENVQLKNYQMQAQQVLGTVQFNLDSFQGKKYQSINIQNEVRTLLALTKIEFASTYRNSDIIDIWNINNQLPSRSFQHIGAKKEGILVIELISADIITSGSQGDYSIKFFNWKTGQLIQQLNGHTSFIYFILKIQDDLICSGGNDKSLKFWNWKNNKNPFLKEIKTAHNETITYCVQINNNQLMTSGNDYYLKFWDINTLKCLNQVKDLVCYNFILQLTEKLYALTDSDGHITIYDIILQQKNKQFKAHTTYIRKLIKLNDNIIASESDQDKTIKIWDISELLCRQQLPINGNCIRGLINLGDQYLVSGTYNQNEIIIWM